MALTVTSVAPPDLPQAPHPHPPGAEHTKLYFATGDSSYPTGGYLLGAAQVPDPANVIHAVDVVGFVGVAGAVEASYNYATRKLQFFQNTAAETAAATNVAAVVVTCRIWFT